MSKKTVSGAVHALLGAIYIYMLCFFCKGFFSLVNAPLMLSDFFVLSENVPLCAILPQNQWVKEILFSIDVS